ncbi:MULTISPECIES: tetratricopeptide repeat protein [unclassified Arcicella]|uniref:tetratricopeptide repeat protein n=1 Tax=unclassified Arcicella TaxID=2644986 RepID=UPI002854A6C1|nr:MULTISPECIES: tetratricopeptide repeat protein [unclassified Arcicella]MDR6564143.1 tetratricopeptide (TPR) repeat protein [Arcicella sp. BE51]MDR6813896.1 tetratricopeptide (TPR) repeat protein [Arcicella sp. BE140]MDR6825208.1 tetratricopeptide (TPR) repeat protein [Arcicella sp. BE139]
MKTPKFYIVLLLILMSQQRVVGQTEMETQSLIRQYQFEKAIVSLSNCSTTGCRLDLAYCQTKVGRIKEAIENYQAILDQDPNNALAMMSLANLYEKTNKLYQAKKSYQSLLNIDSTNAFVYKSYAMLCLKLTEDSLAKIYFKKAITISPSDAESIAELGKLFVKADSLSEAKVLIKKGLLLDSTYITFWQLNARVNYRESKFKPVVSSIKKAMALGDSSVGYQQLLGYAYFYLDSIPQSVACFERVLKVEMESEPAFFYLGLCYTKLKKEDLAIQYFQQAINAGLSDDLPKYYERIGFIDEKNARYNNALEAYQKALEYSGKADYLYLIARVNDWKSTDKSKALKLYKQYMLSKNKKNNEYISLATERIKELETVNIAKAKP